MIVFDIVWKWWIEVYVRNLGLIFDFKLVDCDGLFYFVICVWKGGQMESIDVWRQKLRFVLFLGNGVVDLFFDVEWEEVDRMFLFLFW